MINSRWIHWVCTYLMIRTVLCQSNLVPDFHWTFDVNENNKTYEVNSVTHNVGMLMEGTKIVPSNERHGSVAYFNGVDSGIIIDNVTSNCFLNPGLCSSGLTFSFWIRWEKWGLDPIVMSPNVTLKQMSETIVGIEIWNGQKAWFAFHASSSIRNGIWLNFLFTWDKVSLKVFFNGVLSMKVVSTSFVRSSVLASSASKYPSRLAIGRFVSSNDALLSKVRMYFDDLQIWERPLSDKEAVQVYHSEIYSPKHFKVEDISAQPQFSYISKTQESEAPSAVITTQLANSLIDCFKVCSKISRCAVVGYKANGMHNECQVRDGIDENEMQKKQNEGFHFYSVD